MKHFMESLEREIDFSSEYYKLEKMIMFEKHDVGQYDVEIITLNDWISQRFRSWKKRRNYTSLNELRTQLGFISYQNGKFVQAKSVDINQYFLFCEMILNLVTDLKGINNIKVGSLFEDVIDTMQSVIAQVGFEIKNTNQKIVIVEKNTVAIEVADIVPELADVIIEYNHYLLKGDLDRKKEILKKIADALEPKRSELEKKHKRETSDFFFLVNTMNVRHNNCDPQDTNHYCEPFAKLSSEEKEAWFDLIYEQALTLFVLKNQENRNQIITSFRKELGR